MPKDKTGLNGTAWKHLPDTEIVKRTKSATGVEARDKSAKTHSQVTAPKIKCKAEKEADFGELVRLQRQYPQESREDFLERLSSLAPVVKRGK